MRFSALGLLAAMSWLGIQWELVSTQLPKTNNTILRTSLVRIEQQATKNNSSNCPADLETLTSLLLKDLPSYANRVIQRTRRRNRSVDLFSYVIVAGKPEFEPLSLGPGQYTSVVPAAESQPPQQVFFTTLERQYSNGKVIERENYHWLFLTQTPSGWRLAMVFTRLGSTSKEHPPLPPRETSNGVIGQAVRLWLRDYRYRCNSTGLSRRNAF